MANEYSADVPKGFNIPKQVRLDSITGIQNEAILKNLGTGNNLAFKYYDGLKVRCKDEKTEYIWREVVGIETGLLDTAFTYPTYPPVDGVDYSGKTYNFFLLPTSNTTSADGSETKINSGTNITITGLGTIASPYIINSTDTVANGSETKINNGTNITITGIGTVLSPYVINADLIDLGIVKTVDNEVIAPAQSLAIINSELTGKVLTTKEYVQSVIPSTPDGSETKINAGENITVTGTGTILNPFIINADLTKKEIISTTLTVTEDVSNIYIELPAVSEIPSLIVNNAYTGIEELGTASKPFKTIQAALDAYKGIGGKGTILDPTNPELLGSTIQIEKGSGTYTFTGDFNYKNLNLLLKEGAVIQSTPISSWLMDFSVFSTTTSHNPIITFLNGSAIYCNKNGFKLEGGDFAIGTNLSKRLTLESNSQNSGIILVGTLESDILFEIDGNNLQYINGNYPHLSINSALSTNRGRLFVIKGNGLVSNDSNSIYFLNDPNAVTITNTYSPIEIRNNGVLLLNKSSVQLSKTPTVTYNQLVSTYDSARLEAIDTIFRGTATYFTYNNSAANTSLISLDACKMYMITDTSFAGTISGIWSNMALTNNNMPNTSINSSTTTLIPASINIIGGKVIETLNTYVSKSAAVVAGLPIGAKFINKVDITSGSFIIGVEYKILTIGTTDFTLIGASSNTIGLYFTATGIGIGTGTASLIKVDIVN